MLSEIFRTYVAGILSPTFFTAILLSVGCFLVWKNKWSGKILITIGTVLFLLLGTAPLRFTLYHLTETNPGKLPEDYKYVVVLGGKIFPNEQHPTSSQITPSLLSRLAHGVALVNAREGSILVLTGRGAGEIPEAHLMKKFALEMGLAPERIITEQESLNTKDHPKYLAPVLKKDKFLIVTSSNHMKRALDVFKTHGLEGHPAPTDFANKKETLDLESLIVRGENFSAIDKWMTELYSTMWNHVRKVFNI